MIDPPPLRRELMSMKHTDPRLDELLHLLSPPRESRLWFGGAGPIGCLRGVSSDAASWKPYSQGHSIWQLTLHMAYWIYAVRRTLDGTPKGSFPRSPSNWPDPPESPDPSSCREDRALVKGEYTVFVDLVRDLPAQLLDKPAPGSRKYRHIDLLLGVIQHNTHHTAQIQLLKRLYSSKQGAPP